METVNIRNVRIGDVLKEYGYVNELQLQQALDYQKANKGKRLGNVLIEMGFITEKQMLSALAERLNLRTVEIADLTVHVDATQKIPQALAEKYGMLAVDVQDGMLQVVTNDPINFYGQEEIRQLSGMELQLMLCEREPLEQAIAYYYSEVAAHRAAVAANVSSVDEELQELDADEGGDDTPIINLVNTLIRRAYAMNASDIHIEPFETNTLVRMRIDGTITDYLTLKRGLHPSLITRIKILSEMDIAEHRVPQDGHFRLAVDGMPVNIRVSVIPTVFGEKAVLRLLASNNTIDHRSHYGMEDNDYELLCRMLKSPNGIVYLTGPTGSGKTTTLYMILEELSKKSVNISTIEDPVEKNLPRINQMQVNTVAGLTFEIGLRALLRQDPDIIMVGETRDAETAEISVRAAITGHQVFSTLHTNDATSTIVRLEDMGLAPYMVANSLVGVVAQRLMRKVCPACGSTRPTTAEEKAILGEDVETVPVAKGCSACSFTGYRGRLAIHEIFMVDAQVRKLISEGASTDEIKDYAIREQGMVLLQDAAARKVREGVTTMEELLKVAYYV